MDQSRGIRISGVEKKTDAVRDANVFAFESHVILLKGALAPTDTTKAPATGAMRDCWRG
jgi:hypothetical protein